MVQNWILIWNSNWTFYWLLSLDVNLKKYIDYYYYYYYYYYFDSYNRGERFGPLMSLLNTPKMSFKLQLTKHYIIGFIYINIIIKN